MLRSALMLGLLAVTAVTLPAHAERLRSVSFTDTCASVQHKEIPLKYPVRAGVEILSTPCVRESPILQWDIVPFGDWYYIRSHAQANGRDLCITQPNNAPKDRDVQKAGTCDQTLAQLWTRTLVDGTVDQFTFTSALSGGTRYCLTVSNNISGALRVVMRPCVSGDDKQMFRISR